MAAGAATASRNGKQEATVAPNAGDSIVIPKLDIREARLTLRGISPLIVNRFSEKASSAIEDAQTGKAKAQKGARNPEQEFKDAAYVIPGREDVDDWQEGKYYFPASAFKHAYLYGIGQLDDVKRFPKTKATGWVYVDEDPELHFDSITLRTDIGRNPTRPVYRPQYNGWSVDLLVGYNGAAITIDQVVGIFDLGGFSGGIGEWRPSSPKNKSGSFGRFRVEKVAS